MSIPFTKMQALGNDYLVIEPTQIDRTLSTAEIRRLCDRHFGVGADGLLLGPTIAPHGAAEAVIGLRIFNSDGSECEKSGNGLRMFAAYMRRKYLTDDRFAISVLAGSCEVEIFGKMPWDVSVDMGEAVHLGVADLDRPGGGNISFHRVDLGNPHSVAFVADPTEAVARTIGGVGRSSTRSRSGWVERSIMHRPQ